MTREGARVREWREALLGDLLTLQRGFDITKKAQVPGSVPVVSSSGIASFHDEARAEGPGVVIGRKGSLGTVFFVDRPYWPHDTTLWVKDFRGHDPFFCYLLLQTLPLASLDAGSSNPTLNRNHAHTLPVRIPPLCTQQRIGAFFAGFDDLIQINERRIELLERLARSLYREWFVRFRFPGTERGAKREGLPAGWDKRPASDAGTFLNGYAFKPTDWGPDGPPIIKIKELRGGLSAATPRYVGNAVPSKYLVDRGDLLFSWSGHLGVYLWPNERGYLNQHLFKVLPTADLTVEWLFHALVSALPAFDARAQGTTMRHIKRSALTEVELVVPTRDILDVFTRSVRPLHRESLLLQHANQTLRTIGDLLLPRLVTGRLDISQVDLGDLLPADAA